MNETNFVWVINNNHTIIEICFVFHIQGENCDPSAVDFLQDLAMETYGSFHIINIATQGTVERVTPVYRAEKSAEQIIRTTNGNIYSGVCIQIYNTDS